MRERSHLSSETQLSHSLSALPFPLSLSAFPFSLSPSLMEGWKERGMNRVRKQEEQKYKSSVAVYPGGNYTTFHQNTYSLPLSPCLSLQPSIFLSSSLPHPLSQSFHRQLGMCSSVTELLSHTTLNPHCLSVSTLALVPLNTGLAPSIETSSL